jgi:hypothetical protein
MGNGELACLTAHGSGRELAFPASGEELNSAW